MVGWQEFASNRTAILAKFDLAKIQNLSRPVRTEHGATGEAAIREWLNDFLPTKYRVTSGYIIPDVVQTPNYKLYHHDVIIFDALNAPTLWTEGNPDHSEQGKRRAIPARYVHSVIEVKSAFGKESAKGALEKLSQLNLIYEHFPKHFSCFVIFMELPDSLVSKGELLSDLLPHSPIFGFSGGLILRSGLNLEMSGQISISSNDGSPGSVQNNPAIPFAKDMDQLNIFINGEGNCIIAESGGGATFVSDGLSNWMVSKNFSPIFCVNGVCVCVSWSANGFSQFALHLLGLLEGSVSLENPYRFGQIFDHLERRS
jgi:hypothetical protein